MKKCINLKPHEAAALARGETITIWRALSRPLTEFPDGRWSWIVDSTERTHRDMWVYGWPDPNGHRYTERGRESCDHFREPFPLNVPLLGKETWRCVGITGVSLSGVEQDAEWVDYACDGAKFGAWRSASQMPAWAVRTLVTLSDVRVRKPCDVTEEEAKAMGFKGGNGSIPDYPFSATPREHWKHQWGWAKLKPEWNLYHWSYTATPSKNLS
jgi:hypothetical protein